MKGNTFTPRGIIFSSYKKPSIFERLLARIMRVFEKPRKLKNRWDAI